MPLPRYQSNPPPTESERISTTFVIGVQPLAGVSVSCPVLDPPPRRPIRQHISTGFRIGIKVMLLSEPQMMMSIKRKRLQRDIHDDHLMNILSRLPARSLVRLGLVSKKWLSLTRDPYFISIHHSHRKDEKNPCFAKLALQVYYYKDLVLGGRSGMVHVHIASSPSNDMDFEQYNHLADGYKNQGFDGILGGMVLITSFPSNDMNFKLTDAIDVGGNVIGRGRSKSAPHPFDAALRPCCGLLGFYSEIQVLLVNPTTQEQKHVFFDDWEEDDAGGFVTLGFDPAAMKFKLVLLVVVKGSITRCDVLRLESSSSSEWETVDSIDRQLSDNTACVDGILYFLAEKGTLIVRFDLSSEKFDIEEVLVPLQFATAKYDHQLHELEGCLCLTFTYVVEQSAFVDIWVLKDTSTSTNGIWENKHSLLLPPISPYDGLIHVEILWVSKNKVWFCQERCCLYCYDVLAGTYSQVSGWGKQPLDWVGGFVESMFSFGGC